jgi:hypothetical protein
MIRTAIPASAERNLLDHYFSRVHNKLEADALLFNRQLPHSGLVGTGNEQAIAEVLREFYHYASALKSMRW